MDRSLRIRTPESIAFSYELAGLGSRFLAVIVDMLIQAAILAGIFWGLALIGAHAPKAAAAARSASASESLAIAIVAGIVFIVFFGYFIAFESLWNGQTPGKKLLGIRVVRDGGFPIDLGACAVRNIVRAGELPLGFYAVSAVVCIASPENKRLGDLAAGTIVVRDAKAETLETIVAEPQEHARTALIGEEEQSLIDRFNARRKGLSPDVRERIARELASRVRPRVSYDLQGLADEDLLARLSAS